MNELINQFSIMYLLADSRVNTEMCEITFGINSVRFKKK